MKSTSRSSKIRFWSIASAGSDRRKLPRLSRLLRAAWAFWIFAPPGIAAGNEISVGEASIVISSPPGFSPVTREMQPLFGFVAQSGNPANVRLIAFIPEDKIAGAESGQIPEFSRFFFVEVEKDLVHASASAANFKKVKDSTRELLQNKDQVFQGLPKVAEQVSRNYKEFLDMDMDVEFGAPIVLPVHEETDRSIASSMFVQQDLIDDQGTSNTSTVAGTSAIVHIEGKMLFLYTRGDASELQWSRDASSEWVKAILHANPKESH